VFLFDHRKLKFSQDDQKLINGPPIHRIDLKNNGEEINNLRLIKCDDREFVCTVDFGGNVRMLFLDNLTRECIKFENVYPECEDNSTWSLCGASVNPPRVVVGSNAHKVTIFNLQTGLKSNIPKAHKHNVPCVSFSPCGKFIASTSIDRSVKIWTEYPVDSGAYVLVKMCYPSKDWGWAVQWIDKQKTEVDM
jgi:WD40 repeat protein